MPGSSGGDSSNFHFREKKSGIGLGDRKTARMEGKMMVQKEVAGMATAQTFWYLH